MTKILFVCLGNICRSPMAEFVMKRLVSERGLSSDFEIESAAVSNYEVGNPVYPPAAAKLRSVGIDCTGKHSRQITKADYKHFDYIIGMDEGNRKALLKYYDNDPEGKISLLLDHTERPRSIDDPWYTGDFETAYTEIEEGAKALLSKI